MRHLLSLSIGPVQDFIAAARRTADLHAGSQLLQRVVQAAAETLPAPSASSWGVGRVFPVTLGSGGSNKLLAVVGDDPAAAAAKAEQAAKAALSAAWADARDAMGSQAVAVIDDDRAQRQVQEFLEFYAAWVPVTEATYPQARLEVEALLAGTKSLRAFRQQCGDDARIANSALDPARPNVLARAGKSSVPEKLVDVAPLWLKSTELLDAVSLLKRALSARGSATRLGRVLSTRELAQRTKEPGYSGDLDTEPEFAYFAVLVADGDRMGERLGGFTSPATHRLFAEKLNAFSRAAAVHVEAADGQLVYAGGDDVLALLPVKGVVGCARRLAEEFATQTASATLSVGVAIVHYKEPLTVSVARARDAEHAAKVERNSLAVAVHKRSGNPVIFTERWPDSAASAEGFLSRWIGHYDANRVSRSLGYVLRELALDFPSEASGDVLTGEVCRVLAHSESDPAVAVDVPPLADVDDLDRFVTLLLVSRFLSGVGS